MDPVVVSVIIPNYNHSQFLKQRIESILKQTYRYFEIIILDDGSCDNSKDVIESYRGKNKISHIVYNAENSGSTFKQWRKGADLAIGTYLWIAESDDYADKKFLKILVGNMLANEQTTLAFCNSYIVNDEGKELDFTFWGEDLDRTKWENDYVNNGIDEITRYLLYKNIIVNASAVIFRKEDFLNIDSQLYSDFKFAGDWLIWVNLLHTGSVIYTAEKLNYFRFHASSTRAAKSISQEIKRIEEYFKVINFIEQKYSLETDVKKHLWIVEEWYQKRKLFKRNFLRFIFPPFNPSHLSLFFSYLLAKKKEQLKRYFHR